MKLFGKKKEPTIQEGLNAMENICNTDKHVLYSQLLGELAKHDRGIDRNTLIENSLAFLKKSDKKSKELYFTAARGALHKMIFRGTVFVGGSNSPSPTQVVLTEKGKLEYAKSQLKNEKRNRDEKTIESPAEMINSLIG